ncbi:hypothetical protein CA830_39580, partial [Burkholderia multivorans]
MTSTHDLPTVAGWWRGIDLGWRRIAAEHEQARARPANAEPEDRHVVSEASDTADTNDVNAADTAERTYVDPDAAAARAATPDDLAERDAARAALWR